MQVLITYLITKKSQPHDYASIQREGINLNGCIRRVKLAGQCLALTLHSTPENLAQEVSMAVGGLVDIFGSPSSHTVTVLQ